MTMDRNSPSFVLYPVNNNRTAWRPIGLPVILAVPRIRDAEGLIQPFAFPFTLDQDGNSSGGIKIYILNTPSSTIVAGVENRGLTGPNNQVYLLTLSRIELAERTIDVQQYSIRRTNDDGSVVFAPISELQDGDEISYTTSSNVTHYFSYYSDADYFDLSDVTLDTEQLPHGLYTLVYESTHFARALTEDASKEFICIDPNLTAVSQLRFDFNHPGDVIAEFERLTPAIYLDNANRAADKTLGLYRIFTDILQDVKDEQDLLKRINFVFSSSPEGIPYLSSLLGWELPYFPQSLSREIGGQTQSLDNLRRAVLRRTVELQNLRGSSKALTRIFSLFGYKILVNNLYWTSDAKKLVRVGQRQPSTGPYKDQSITEENGRLVYGWHTEYVENNLNCKALGFYDTESPLLFRPQLKSGLDEFQAFIDAGSITIVAMSVNPDVAEELQKIDLETHSTYYGYDLPTSLVPYLKQADNRSIIFEVATESTAKNPVTILNGLVSSYDKEYTYFIDEEFKLRITQDIDNLQFLPVPILPEAVRFDRDENKLQYALNGFVDDPKRRIFMFATYKKVTITEVPAGMIPSNWFDIQVLNRDESDTIDATALDFALDFLVKLKAFHSLLYLISTRSIVTEVYQVTDFGVGGAITQRYDTDAGKQQVPPAIRPLLPETYDDCNNRSVSVLGYKQADLDYRNMVLQGLEAEWEAYNSLKRDTRNLPCPDNLLGQDRITMAGYNEVGISSAGGERAKDTNLTNRDGVYNEDFSAPVSRFCAEDGKTDFAYKGRVADRLAYSLATQLDETWSWTSCKISMGQGAYYLYPRYSKIATPGVKSPERSQSGTISFSGGAPTLGIEHYKSSVAGKLIDKNYAKSRDNFLGRLYRSYAEPSEYSLHYVNQTYSGADFQFNNLALQRPTLGIVKTNMHFPGCRFPMMNKLLNDYTSPYDKRPWDVESCDNPCNIDDLNPELVLGTEGSEFLIYDTVSDVILGNGLTPDVPGLNGQVPVDPTLFVHRIYGKQIAAGSTALYLEQQDHSEGIISTTLTGIFDGVVAVGGVVTDDIFGYPSQYGYMPYTMPQQAVQAFGSDVVLDDATFPTRAGYYLTFGSGMRDLSDVGYRLDCSSRSGDEIDLLSVMDLDEEIYAGNYYLNGEISSLLETA